MEALKKEEETVGMFGAQKIIDVLLRVQSVKEKNVNQLIKDKACDMYITIREEKKKNYEPLKVLLSCYGLPNDVIAEHEEKKRQEEQQAEEEAAELEKKKLEEQLKQKAEGKPDGSAKRSNSLRHSETQLVPLSEKQKSGAKQYQLVPYQPQLDLSQKALVAIERIKREKEERELHVLTQPFIDDRKNKLRNKCD